MIWFFDHAGVTVECPHCRRPFDETVVRLRDEPRLTCLPCDREFRYEGGLARLLLQAATQKVKRRPLLA